MDLVVADGAVGEPGRRCPYKDDGHMQGLLSAAARGEEANQSAEQLLLFPPGQFTTHSGTGRDEMTHWEGRTGGKGEKKQTTTHAARWVVAAAHYRPASQSVVVRAVSACCCGHSVTVSIGQKVPWMEARPEANSLQ